jgi:CBS domain-containing protein
MLISEVYYPYPKTLNEEVTILDALAILLREKQCFNRHQFQERSNRHFSLQDIAAATVPSQFRKNVRMAAAMYKRGFFTEMCQQIKDLPVSRSCHFVSVDMDDNIMSITADFLKNDLYVVLVIEGKKLMGVVTRTEIKKALLYGMRKLTPQTQ